MIIEFALIVLLIVVLKRFPNLGSTLSQLFQQNQPNFYSNPEHAVRDIEDGISSNSFLKNKHLPKIALNTIVILLKSFELSKVSDETLFKCYQAMLKLKEYFAAYSFKMAHAQHGLSVVSIVLLLWDFSSSIRDVEKAKIVEAYNELKLKLERVKQNFKQVLEYTNDPDWMNNNLTIFQIRQEVIQNLKDLKNIYLEATERKKSLEQKSSGYTMKATFSALGACSNIVGLVVNPCNWLQWGELVIQTGAVGYFMNRRKQCKTLAESFQTLIEEAEKEFETEKEWLSNQASVLRLQRSVLDNHVLK